MVDNKKFYLVKTRLFQQEKKTKKNRYPIINYKMPAASQLHFKQVHKNNVLELIINNKIIEISKDNICRKK